MPHFEPCLRWFGPTDPVTLAHVRQAGATGVVTALHHVACGEPWTPEAIRRRNEEVEAAGLRWSVAESVPVHEDVKRRTGECETYLDRYVGAIRNLGRAGVRTVCYNFMAVTDWTRTEVAMRLPSGAVALRFDAVHVACFDRYVLKRPGAEKDHADDANERADEEGLRRIVEAVDSPANGITFCSGSLGAWEGNDLPGILRRLGDRVHFLHLRSVRREADGGFFEDDHLAGSSDMVEIVRAAIELSERRGASLPMRPDHGHLDDLHREGFYPGYSYVGRLKGLAELRGLELGFRSRSAIISL